MGGFDLLFVLGSDRYNIRILLRATLAKVPTRSLVSRVCPGGSSLHHQSPKERDFEGVSAISLADQENPNIRGKPKEDVTRMKIALVEQLMVEFRGQFEPLGTKGLRGVVEDSADLSIGFEDPDVVFYLVVLESTQHGSELARAGYRQTAATVGSWAGQPVGRYDVEQPSLSHSIDDGGQETAGADGLNAALGEKE